MGLGAAALAAPSAAAPLSAACTSINNNEMGGGGNTGMPSGVSGTYRINASGSQWDGNFSNYNKTFAAGEVISWSYTTTQGTPYVHVLQYDMISFAMRSVSARNMTATSGSGSLTIQAGQESDYFNIAVTDYQLDSSGADIPQSSDPSRRNTATNITLSCGPGASPAPSLSSFSYGGAVAYNTGGASGTTINVATGGNATQSPTGYTVASAANGSFGASSTTNGGGVVSINSAGVASYTPRTGYRGADTFYAKASNGGGASSAATVTVTVSSPTLTATLTGSGAKRGVALAGYAVTPSGGNGPYSCVLSNGSSLPSGVTLGANCALTGTPGGSGTFSFNVDVTDSSVTGANGGTASAFTKSGVAISNFAVAQAAPAITGVSPNSGPEAGGTAVTLTGTDFTGATGLSFGGVSVFFSVNSPTTITATSPAHAAGAVNIVVSGPGGDSATGASSQFVYDAPAAPTVTLAPATGALPAATVGANYSASVSASGAAAPYSFAVTSGALPAGLALASDGTLSGTPTQAGDFSFTVTGTDATAAGAGGPYAASAAYTLHVGAATVTIGPVSLPAASFGAAYSQTLTASGGVATYGYAVTSGALPAGLTLTGGLLSGSPTVTGTFNFTITATDSATGTGAPFTGSRSYSLVVAGPTVSVGPGTLSAGAVGVAYSAAISASGGVAPYSYAVTAGALPPGVTLAADGALSGAPTSGGVYNVTITATDSAGGSGPFTGSQAYVLTINAPTVALAPSSLPAGALGVSYSQTVSASGGVTPYSYAVTAGALPAGLSFSTATGAISGSPTAAGTFNFTITATDSAGGAGPYTASQSYSLTIAAPTLTLSPSTVTGGQVGVIYSQTFSASGGVGPYSYAVSAGALPAGLGLSSSGVVSGTPTAPGSFNVTITATDASTGAGPYAVSSGYTLVITAAATPPVTNPPVTEPPVTEPPVTEPPVTEPPVTEPPVMPPPVITPPAPVTSATDNTQQGPATVSLPATTTGAVTTYEIATLPAQGRATLQAPSSAGGSDWALVYTPVSTFMGEATVQVVAVGPGGKSAPADFVFRVSGKAPDLDGTAVGAQPLVFNPTQTLTGGPFQALRITRQPATGKAEVVGLTIVYTAGASAVSASAERRASSPVEGGAVSAAAVGAPSLDYVVVLPFGDSSPGRIDIKSVAGPTLTPLTASTLAGRAVTVSLTEKATGGPFTAAQVVSVTSGAGATSVVEGGVAGARTYDLVFTPQGAFTGEAIVTYTLSNAGASTQGVLKVQVEPRPDPSLDPDVRGVVSAQVDSARRFARSQTDNFHRRLEQVRRGGGWSNALRLNLPLDGPDQDPQQAMRRQLGLPDVAGDSPRPVIARALDSVANLADTAPVAASGRGPGRDGVSPIGVWTAGAIDWGHRDGRGKRDYRFSTSGVSGGVDWKLSDRLVLGLGLGYGHDRTEVGANNSLSRGENYVGAVYGGWRGKGKLVIDGVLGYGALTYDSQRWSADAGKLLTGDRSGSVLFGSASVALEQTARALSWSPYARIQFSTVELDGFTERGADVFALSYQSLESRSLSSVLGASFDWSAQRHSGTLAANLRFEWRHAFEGTGNQVVSYADWTASPNYQVGLERWARDSVSLATGVEWRAVSGWRLGSDYTGELGSGLASHGVRLKMMKDF